MSHEIGTRVIPILPVTKLRYIEAIVAHSKLGSSPAQTISGCKRKSRRDRRAAFEFFFIVSKFCA